jgi:D-lactate dehydrogenase (cytochrome)
VVCSTRDAPAVRGLQRKVRGSSDPFPANAVRYGTARAEWFLNATIVLPSGEVIKTRQRARKSSAGFDTTKLFIGSEGTLGIVTELTVRLAPLLPTSVAVVAFPDVRAAVAASTEIVNAVGAGVQCVELCDNEFMRATNIHGVAKRKYAEKDSLYLKFQGPTDRAIQEAAGIARDIAEKHGGSGFEFAQSKEDADALWQDRKNALWSGMALSPGSKAWSTDVWFVTLDSFHISLGLNSSQCARIAAPRPSRRDKGRH